MKTCGYLFVLHVKILFLFDMRKIVANVVFIFALFVRPSRALNLAQTIDFSLIENMQKHDVYLVFGMS